jgi:hypothetical protein
MFLKVRVPFGAIAQLGERVLCKHEVVGSIPSGSTIVARPEGRLSRVEEFAAASCSRRSVTS